MNMYRSTAAMEHRRTLYSDVLWREWSTVDKLAGWIKAVRDLPACWLRLPLWLARNINHDQFITSNSRVVVDLHVMFVIATRCTLTGESLGSGHAAHSLQNARFPQENTTRIQGAEVEGLVRRSARKNH
jgi:hypothetical protein